MQPLPRLSAILGGGPTLFIKRDDAIPFAFGGNKVRKLAFVAAEARDDGADTLITAGGVQSNHARVTAAVAATLGMRAVLVANGDRRTGRPPTRCSIGCSARKCPRGEPRGAHAGDADAADRCRAEGRRSFTIPIGASTPLGALAFALARRRTARPDAARPT